MGTSKKTVVKNKVSATAPVAPAEKLVSMVDHVVTAEDLAVLNDSTIKVGDTVSVPSDHPVALATDVESATEDEEELEDEGDGVAPELAKNVTKKGVVDMALIDNGQFVRRIPVELNHTIEGLIGKKENADTKVSSRSVIPFSSIDTITCMYEMLDKKNDLQRMTKVFSVKSAGRDFDAQAVVFRNETRGTLVYTTK